MYITVLKNDLLTNIKKPFIVHINRINNIISEMIHDLLYQK